MAGTIDQLIKLSGAQQVKAELTAIGKEGERAFSGIEKSANSASGAVSKVGDAAGQASGGINSVGRAAEAAAGSFLRSGQFATLAAGGIIGLGAALVGLAKGFLDSAAAAAKLINAQAAAAQKAGQSTKNYAEVEGALKQIGLSADEATDFIKKFGAGTTEVIKTARDALAKKGITFAPGIAGDAEALKMMGGDAAKNMAPLFELAKQSGAAFDPMTGALKLTTENVAILFDNLQKLKSPLERIQALMKMGFGEEAARRIEPRAALGGEPVRKEAADVERLQNANAEKRKEQERIAAELEKETARLKTVQESTLRDTGTKAAEIVTPLLRAYTEALIQFNTAKSQPGPVLGDPTAGLFDPATGSQLITFLTNAAQQLFGLKQSADETKTSLGQIGAAAAPDFTPLVAAANEAFKAIIEGAIKTAEALRRILPGGGGAPALVPSGPGKMASGGSVRGPGSGTSDSILARLSNGEYVVKAAAVRHYGSGMLAAINSMRFAGGGPVPRFAAGGQAQQAQARLLQTAMDAGLRAAQATNKEMQEHQKKISEILNSLMQAFTGGIGGVQIGFGPGRVNQLGFAGGGAVRGFNMGGLVGALPPMRGFAGGGLVPAPSQGRSLHPVTINMPGGGGVGGLLAPPSVVDRLEREVLLKSPTGRAPGWRGR